MDHRAGMDSAYPMYTVPCSPALESMGERVKKIQKGCMSGMAVRYDLNGFVAEPFPLIEFHLKRVTKGSGPPGRYCMNLYDN